MRGYLIDVQNGNHRVVEIKDEDRLSQYYSLIQCDCIDIVVRSIGKTYFNVVIDDEGLLVGKPKFSIIDTTHEPMIAGNVILFGIEEASHELRSLTNDEVYAIHRQIMWAIDFDSESLYPVIKMGY